MTRENRIEILQENLKITKELPVKPCAYAYVPFSDKHINQVDAYANKQYDKSRIIFEKTDTISAALKYEGDFLVFASSKHYGGGVWNGAKAQEEDIFLCTDLGFCNDEVKKKQYYPLNGTLVVDCNIIRNANFDELETPKGTTAFFTAAPNLRNGSPNPNYADFNQRMCTFALTADSCCNNYSLILGAWGCGVFKNDPYEVAKLFKKTLPLLQEKYTSIIFAIPDEKLLNIFKKVIC